jgi:nucleoside 2-deoxyribosyltransferase
MKVYLAAPYVTKDAVKERAVELRARGIEVTSRWLEEPHKSSTQLGELSFEDHQKYALQDVEDVIAADVLVFFTDPTKTILRGGRHVEFGIAVALGMPIFVVGFEEENIFHYLPAVQHDTWEETVKQLLILRDVETQRLEGDLPF